ncbi:hypothetical protein [Brevundimonas sp. CEF1]|uniref:hypothetical protein n=1 Tax=Brevundimonas sp. CEF1 TaxID=3442642 RepID=UPI003F517467
MNAAEFKELEGQRIQQVLGAIGALPAAMLVFGDGPSTAAAGAPLFVAAIALIVGSIMHWNYTDGAYHLDTIEHDVRLVDQPKVDLWQEDLERAGYWFQGLTYYYGISSLICSVAGVAAVYSTIRLSVSVEIGFLAAGAVTIAVCTEIVLSGRRRNQLLKRCRILNGLPKGGEAEASPGG